MNPLLHRVATSAVGTYAAYVAHGLRHPKLLRPAAGRDAQRALPGDALVRDPRWSTTFTIDIDAPPERVWPWIVQIGWGRAGWYTWYRYDNGGVPSAERIVPELQQLRVGDVIPDGPRANEGFGVWRVHTLEPPHVMVLFSRRNPFDGRELAEGDEAEGMLMPCSWAFVLEPHGATRLYVRVRARIEGAANGAMVAAARVFFGLGDNVMEKTMLEGIKARAERRE